MLAEVFNITLLISYILGCIIILFILLIKEDWMLEAILIIEVVILLFVLSHQ